MQPLKNTSFPPSSRASISNAERQIMLFCFKLDWLSSSSYLVGGLEVSKFISYFRPSLTRTFIFTALLNFFSVASWTFYLLTVLGLLILRVKEPHLDRPYRAWLVTPIIFCAVAMFLLLMPIFAAPWEAFAAFGKSIRSGQCSRCWHCGISIHCFGCANVLSDCEISHAKCWVR